MKVYNITTMTYQVLYKTMLGVLACLLVPSSCSDLHVVETRRAGRVDCRKYVFAPVCRGVAAKRNLVPKTNAHDVIKPPVTFDDVILRSALSSLRNHDSDRNWSPSESSQNVLRQSLFARDEDDRKETYSLDDQNVEEDLLLPKLLIRRSVYKQYGL